MNKTKQHQDKNNEVANHATQKIRWKIPSPLQIQKNLASVQHDLFGRFERLDMPNTKQNRRKKGPLQHLKEMASNVRLHQHEQHQLNLIGKEV